MFSALKIFLIPQLLGLIKTVCTLESEDRCMAPAPRPPDTTTETQKAPQPSPAVDPTPAPPPPDPKSTEKLDTVVSGGPNAADKNQIPTEVLQALQSIEKEKLPAARFWQNFINTNETRFKDSFEAKRLAILGNWNAVLDFAKTQNAPVKIGGETIVAPSEAAYAQFIDSPHEVIRTQGCLGYLDPEKYGKNLGPFGVAGVDGKEGGFTQTVETDFYNDYKSGKFKELEGKEPDPNFNLSDVSAKAAELAAKKQAKLKVTVAPSQDGNTFEIKQGDEVYAKLVKDGNDFILTVVKEGLPMQVECHEDNKYTTVEVGGKVTGSGTAVKAGNVIHIGPSVDIKIEKCEDNTLFPKVITRSSTITDADGKPIS